MTNVRSVLGQPALMLWLGGQHPTLGEPTLGLGFKRKHFSAHIPVAETGGNSRGARFKNNQLRAI